MNKVETCQKLALAAVTMLSLSLDETAYPRSITESSHWRVTPLTRKLLIDILLIDKYLLGTIISYIYLFI